MPLVLPTNGGASDDDLAVGLSGNSTGNSQSGDPWSAWDSWDTYTINGVACPGIIARDGIRGLDRVTEWDIKAGKGQRGATTTLSQQPLAKGTITSLIWSPGQYFALQDFITDLLYFSDKNAVTNAATIYHPALANLLITNVVVGRIAPLRHLGGKMYHFTAEFIEWAPPPNTSAVATPLTADTVQASDVPGDLPPDVRNAEATYFQAQANHAAAASASKMAAQE